MRPFIETGVVNFIPDPCSFDIYLHREMMDMADKRRAGHEINEKEAERYIELHKEDFKRTIRMFPKEYQRRQIMQAMPDLTPRQIEEVMQYMETQHREDPLALLQDGVIEKGGQLTIVSLAPNFEMALFLAQVTGSIILTDSETRWDEIKTAQFKENGIISYPWSGISTLINKLMLDFNANHETSFHQRIYGGFGNIRKPFREVYSVVRNHKEVPDNIFVKKLKKDLLAGYEMVLNKYDPNDQYNLSVKMSCLMPKGGFIHNNVQRLLLKSGSEKHLNNVPMAIFVEPTINMENQ